MTTLINVVKEVKVCDNPTLSRLYHLIISRLNDIYNETKKHEKEFDKFLIKRNPVANRTTLIITELRSLDKLPAGCLKIKQHGKELTGRLAEFKEDIGTPLCKTPRQAYEFLAEQVVTPFLKSLRHDVAMPELTLQLTRLYTELVQDSSRTQLP